MRKNGAGLRLVKSVEDWLFCCECYPLFCCQGPAFVKKRPIRPNPAHFVAAFAENIHTMI